MTVQEWIEMLQEYKPHCEVRLTTRDLEILPVLSDYQVGKVVWIDVGKDRDVK